MKSDNNTLLLNIISGSLHIGNLVVLSVSASEYLPQLGLTESASGLLYSINWLGALFSLFLFSWWSNFGYTYPCYAQAILAVLGNFLNSFAYQQGYQLAYIGRFLLGLGTPRVLNRRYISDYTNPKERTKWATYYVAGCLLFSSISSYTLRWMNFEADNFGLVVNKHTSPGYIMTILWIIYIVAMALMFKEPTSKNSASSSNKSDQSSLVLAGYGLWAAFLSKLMMDYLVLSAPLVLVHTWNWESKSVATFFSFAYLAVFFTQLYLANYSKNSQESRLLVLSLGIAGVGGSMISSLWYSSLIQYLVGAIVLWSGTHFTDGVTTSFLSKCLPSKYSTGLLNAGFLATLCGTLGRIVAGLIIAYIDQGNYDLLNLLMFPMMVCCVVTMFMFRNDNIRELEGKID